MAQHAQGMRDRVEGRQNRRSTHLGPLGAPASGLEKKSSPAPPSCTCPSLPRFTPGARVASSSPAISVTISHHPVTTHLALKVVYTADCKDQYCAQVDKAEKTNQLINGGVPQLWRAWMLPHPW